MIKKISPIFLFFILILIILSFYQKNNPEVNRIIDSIKIKTTDSNNILTRPTNLIQKPDSESEKIFLQVDEPKNNTTVNNPIININGKTISNAYIFVNEQELRADTDGSFSTATTLDEGENYILIVASNDLGDSEEKDIMVNLESIQ